MVWIIQTLGRVLDKRLVEDPTIAHTNKASLGQVINARRLQVILTTRKDQIIQMRLLT
jgi:hypothetical protein